MSFLLPRDFRNFQVGSSLARYQGPVGDARLYHILDKALTMIEEYIAVPLRAHVVMNESAPVLGASLPIFTEHTPVRAPLRYNVLAWAQQGRRQTWQMPTQVVETPIGGEQPIIFGNVMVDRTHNVVAVTSYAGAMGFPWVGLINQVSELLLTYTAGYDTSPMPPVLSTTVQATPAPTVSAFALPPGWGQLPLINVPITVGAQTAVVSGINGDTVLLATPLATVPQVGDAVTQGDGVSLPPPNWLVDMQRDVASHLVNLDNAYSGGATGVGDFRFGAVQWNLPLGGQPDLPQPIRDKLDKRQESFAGDMA